MAEQRKEVTVSRVVSASREIAFRAWTDPALLVRWWGPDGVTNTECEIEPRVGGVFRVVMVASDVLGDRTGERWPVRGVFREFDAPARLVIETQAVDDDGTVHLDGMTTVLFEDLGNGTTEVTVHATAEGVSDQAGPMLEGMQQGWTETIDKLTAYLSGAPTAV